MNNRIIFLRHADTEKNPLVSAVLWTLSEKGVIQSQGILNIPEMLDVDVIYASSEKKTFLTVEPLSKKINKLISTSFLFDEVKRGDKFLTKEGFEKEKILQLSDLSYNAFGGESGNEALARFRRGVDWVTENNPGKTILIVTHGTILNIYFSYLMDNFPQLPERWRKTEFCAYGVIENGLLIKDIINT
jgi:2,3-bisphosphoglycerate-dependent phosphoglycerate mutase